MVTRDLRATNSACKLSRLRCVGMMVASSRSFIGFNAASIAAAIILVRSKGIACGWPAPGAGICGASTCIREGAACARAEGIAPGVVEATEAGTVPSSPLLVGRLAFGEEPATIPAHDFG